MLSRPLPGIAAVIMAACLFGCGGGDSAEAPAPVDPPPAVEPPPAEPPPAEPPAQTVWPALVRQTEANVPVDSPYGETLLIRDRQTLGRLFPWFFDEAPADIRNPDFSRMSFLRLTGFPQRYVDWAAISRVERIDSSADGLRHTVHLEHCRSDYGMLAPTIEYVPIVLYLMPALQGEIEFKWTQRYDGDCRTKWYPTYLRPHSTTDAPLDGTRRWALRAAGDVYTKLEAPIRRSLVVPNPTLFVGVSQRIEPEKLATFTPSNFVDTWMLYLEAGDTSWKHDSYVRIEAIESDAAGTAHRIRIEACGAETNDVWAGERIFSLYEIPVLPGDVQLEWTRRDPPDCRQPR